MVEIWGSWSNRCVEWCDMVGIIFEEFFFKVENVLGLYRETMKVTIGWNFKKMIKRMCIMMSYGWNNFWGVFCFFYSGKYVGVISGDNESVNFDWNFKKMIKRMCIIMSYGWNNFLGFFHFFWVKNVLGWFWETMKVLTLAEV